MRRCPTKDVEGAVERGYVRNVGYRMKGVGFMDVHGVKNSTLCVVMPVYNEQDAIGGVLEKWDAMLSGLGCEYVIRPYNDGSKDSSLAVMQEMAKRLGPQIEVKDKPNGGHGNTILTGYCDAVADGFDWIFQVDSDDEMGPEQFADLWNRREDYDFLVGTRAGRRQSFSRRIISFVSRLCVRLFYGESIWDVNSPYRLMRVSSFKNLFSSIPLSTFAPNVILSGLSARYGLRCFQMPVPQRERVTGEVSIRKWKLVKSAVKSFCQTIWMARTSTPLLSIVPAFITLAVLDSTTFMWYDELAMCDGVFMKALHGLSWSGVWACSYNPLYPLSLVAWVKLFGASHFVVCSFSVILAYFATVVISSVAHRRRWWNDSLSDCAFVFLFWGGWFFSWMITNARVDVMVLLLTVLFLDSLSSLDSGKNSFLRVFIIAALLFLAAPYILPLMFFFGLFLLVLGRIDRVMLVKRGLVATAGFGAGFIITALYYLVQRDIIRLLGSYLYFNSITGYAFVPFWERVANGYLFDISAVVLLLLSFVLGALSKAIRPYAVFAALIPLLMVIGGRYEPYYAWVFYVPSVVLLVAAIRGRFRRTLVSIAAIGAFSCAVHPVVSYMQTADARANRESCRVFIERNSKWFSGGGDVVVAADLDGNTGFYYPLLKHGVRIWYRGEEMLTGRTDEEKFTEGLAFLPGGEALGSRVKKLIPKIQRFMPLLPEKGFVLFYTEEDKIRLLPMFEGKGKKLEQLDVCGEYSLWRMSAVNVSKN